MNKIKCDNVNYRKGFIEVVDNFHDDCINIETWCIHPDIDITPENIAFEDVPESGFTGNTELELSLKMLKNC